MRRLRRVRLRRLPGRGARALRVERASRRAPGPRAAGVGTVRASVLAPSASARDTTGGTGAGLVPVLARIIHHNVSVDHIPLAVLAVASGARQIGAHARERSEDNTVLDEREPAVRHEMPAPRRSQPAAW